MVGTGDPFNVDTPNANDSPSERRHLESTDHHHDDTASAALRTLDQRSRHVVRLALRPMRQPLASLRDHGVGDECGDGSLNELHGD